MCMLLLLLGNRTAHVIGILMLTFVVLIIIVVIVIIAMCIYRHQATDDDTIQCKQKSDVSRDRKMADVHVTRSDCPQP